MFKRYVGVPEGNTMEVATMMYSMFYFTIAADLAQVARQATGQKKAAALKDDKVRS